MINTCKQCKKIFDTKNKRTLFCSERCRMKALDEARKMAREKKKEYNKMIKEKWKEELYFLLHEREWMKKRGFIYG